MERALEQLHHVISEPRQVRVSHVRQLQALDHALGERPQRRTLRSNQPRRHGVHEGSLPLRHLNLNKNRSSDSFIYKLVSGKANQVRKNCGNFNNETTNNNHIEMPASIVTQFLDHLEHKLEPKTERGPASETVAARSEMLKDYAIYIVLLTGCRPSEAAWIAYHAAQGADNS